MITFIEILIQVAIMGPRMVSWMTRARVEEGTLQMPLTSRGIANLQK